MSQQNPRQRPNHNQAQNPPQAQPSQPEKIYIERKSNPAMMVLKAIAFPFVKIFQAIVYVFSVIFQELVRSIMNLVVGIIIMIIFVALIVGYGYALVQTDFDFVAALPEMVNIFKSLFGFGG